MSAILEVLRPALEAVLVVTINSPTETVGGLTAATVTVLRATEAARVILAQGDDDFPHLTSEEIRDLLDVRAAYVLADPLEGPEDAK